MISAKMHLPSNSPSNLVFFGDSIMAGQYVAPQYRWTALVLDRLRDQFGLQIVADVQARSGETSREAALRFPQAILEYPVDYVVIQLGLNDANVWTSEGGRLSRVSLLSFEANLREMISRCDDVGTRCLALLTSHPSPKVTGSGRPLAERSETYNDTIRRVAIHENVGLVDVAQWWTALDPKDADGLLLPEPDLLHLTRKGHTAYADCVAPALAQLLPRP